LAENRREAGRAEAFDAGGEGGIDESAIQPSGRIAPAILPGGSAWLIEGAGVRRATRPAEVGRLIAEHDLPPGSIPSRWLDQPEV
jgi:hypothetical protein